MAERQRSSVSATAQSDGALRLLPADVRRAGQRARVVPRRAGPARRRRRPADVRGVRAVDARPLLPTRRPRGARPPVQRRTGLDLWTTGRSCRPVRRRAVPPADLDLAWTSPPVDRFRRFRCASSRRASVVTGR